MKIISVVATGALSAGLLLAGGAPALAQGGPTVDAASECGSATFTFGVPEGAFAPYEWAINSGPNSGAVSDFEGHVRVAPGETETYTVSFAEDEHEGSAYASASMSSGPESGNHTYTAVAVNTDCQEAAPEPTFPVDCEISGGVDDGESGTKASAEAECISNSPGYESDEIGGQCVLETGEPGSGEGVVTEGGCEVVRETPGNGSGDGDAPGNGEEPPAGNPGQGEDPPAKGDKENPGNGQGTPPPHAEEPGKPESPGHAKNVSNVGVIHESGEWFWTGSEWHAIAKDDGTGVGTDDGAAPVGGIETGIGGTELAAADTINPLGWVAGGFAVLAAGLFTAAAVTRRKLGLN